MQLNQIDEELKDYKKKSLETKELAKENLKRMEEKLKKEGSNYLNPVLAQLLEIKEKSNKFVDAFQQNQKNYRELQSLNLTTWQDLLVDLKALSKLNAYSTYTKNGFNAAFNYIFNFHNGSDQELDSNLSSREALLLIDLLWKLKDEINCGEATCTGRWKNDKVFELQASLVTKSELLKPSTTEQTLLEYKNLNWKVSSVSQDKNELRLEIIELN